MDLLVIDKVKQAQAILKELNLDAWLIFVRETSAMKDPALTLVYGEHDLTWPSVLLITARKGSYAILGRYEAVTAQNLGAYDKVIAYDQDIKKSLQEELLSIQPLSIAVNISEDDVLADGLSHGMYLTLHKLLEGINFQDRITSSINLISALRGRKTKTEVERVKNAILEAQIILNKTIDFAQPGMSESQIAHYTQDLVLQNKLDFAWTPSNCPIVNAGPGADVGHNAPSTRILQRGQILHFDFGVKKDLYCSDIQRDVYFLAEKESEAPTPVIEAFKIVRKAIQNAFEVIKPGMMGVDVDAVARKTILDAGYKEYMHATGHQVGRIAHDGGCLLGPAWPRYGKTPFLKIEVGQIFTLELGINLDEYGYVGLEEDILITETGAEYLIDPQVELIIK